MSYDRRMELAIDALESSEALNYTAIAKQYNLGRTALARRHQGKTTSRAEATSIYRALLTTAQEEQLIDQINKLTVRFMPPTSKMVKNMAEEIIGREVNKNWTAHFCKRHAARLKSLYLRNIDNQRAKSEYAPMVNHFFELVTLFL
jgi:hypothetical protein